MPSDLPSTGSRTGWNESNDREIVDWKRVRATIDQENGLANHRQTWLITLNAFLFTAFALLFQVYAKNEPTNNRVPTYLALNLICINGILTSVVIGTALSAAFIQIHKLEDWWKEKYKLNDNNDRHPQINGFFHEPIFRWFNPERVPPIFVLTWLGLLIAVDLDILFNLVVGVVGSIPYISTVVATWSFAALFTWWIIEKKGKKPVATGATSGDHKSEQA